MKEYSVVRDKNGYAIAIEKGGDCLLHLVRGATTNEENIDQIVATLNGAILDEPKEADSLNARLNEIVLEIEDLLDPAPVNRLQHHRLKKEYAETYAKLVQLRQDK